MSQPRDAGPTYLAIDIGASSGRAVLGTLAGGRMEMHEVHRFRTPLIEADGHLYWDAEALWAETRAALTQALQAAPGLRSVSVDTWAVDYVPIGFDGAPLRNPYSYRDLRTAGRLAEALRLVGGADAVYARTGIQFLEFNTLPQIVADVRDEPALVARTATRLLIADYLLYLLSGELVAERTIAARPVSWLVFESPSRRLAGTPRIRPLRSSASTCTPRKRPPPAGPTRISPRPACSIK